VPTKPTPPNIAALTICTAPKFERNKAIVGLPELSPEPQEPAEGGGAESAMAMEIGPALVEGRDDLPAIASEDDWVFHRQVPKPEVGIVGKERRWDHSPHSFQFTVDPTGPNVASRGTIVEHLTIT